MNDIQKQLEKIERIMAAPFEARLAAWVARCQELLNGHFAEKYPNSKAPILSIMKGKKYIRIVQTYPDNPNNQLAWAFVDMTNGDILRPNGWKTPAKHARGNIDDDQNGMGCITVYGPIYLK